MDRTGRSLATGASVAFAGCFGSTLFAVLAADQDLDGVNVLIANLAGVPVTAVVAGLVVGAQGPPRPLLTGLAAAELGWAAACIAVTPVLAPSIAALLFLFSHLWLAPVWAMGALGGWAGGWLGQSVRNSRRSS